MAYDVYLVGGAVRDELLGRTISDRDWVVVGASTEELLEAGYQPVGKDFPVFLHPQTHEEYALARSERKSGRGHTQFEFHAEPSVTLEEDLKRRDLTINAIAKHQQGGLIDPFGGVVDLERRILRHVSPAFVEDPLRVFRVARFAAQLADFAVADDTLELMRGVVTSGELVDLSAERVWQETEKALQFSSASLFWQVLAACGGLDEWFPEVVGATLETLTFEDAQLNYAALPLREEQFVTLAQRLKVPNRFTQAALDKCRYAAVIEQFQQASAAQLLDAFRGLGVVHGPQRLAGLVTLLCMDRTPGELLLHGAAQFSELKLTPTADLTGKAFGDALDRKRLQWLEAWLA